MVVEPNFSPACLLEIGGAGPTRQEENGVLSLRRSFAFLILALGMLAWGPQAIRAPGQGDPIYDRVMREKKLRVFAIQSPPQTFRDPTGGDWKGFDADIYRYIASRLGVKLEVVWTVPAAMVLTITSGRADMGTALYRTPERDQLLDFTIPYKWVSDHVVVHADDRGINTIYAFKGKVLGTLRGSAEEIAARKIYEAGFAKEVRVYDSIDSMYRDLNAKRVDGIIAQTVYHQYLQRQNPDLKGRLAFEVEPKYFGRTVRSPSHFPVSKGATKLEEAVGNIIVEMRRNGELARIFGRYGITDPSVWTPPHPSGNAVQSSGPYRYNRLRPEITRHMILAGRMQRNTASRRYEHCAMPNLYPLRDRPIPPLTLWSRRLEGMKC